jgi:hypothetical protein
MSDEDADLKALEESMVRKPVFFFFFGIVHNPVQAM